MNYEVIWELLSSLITELKKHRENIPTQVIKDLRAAKTMIEILKVDSSKLVNLMRIEEYFSSIESYLIPRAEKILGKTFVDDWQEKIGQAHKGVKIRNTKQSRMFPLRIPRDKGWLRIHPTDNLTTEKIKQISKQIGLKLTPQNDGYILVIGKEDKVKEFVKKIAKFLNSIKK